MPAPLSTWFERREPPHRSTGVARTQPLGLMVMFPLIGCCTSPEDGDSQRRRHQQRKLQMLTFWRDGAERQLAALNAAISTLEQQIQRSRPESQA